MTSAQYRLDEAARKLETHFASEGRTLLLSPMGAPPCQTLLGYFVDSDPFLRGEISQDEANSRPPVTPDLILAGPSDSETNRGQFGVIALYALQRTCLRVLGQL